MSSLRSKKDIPLKLLFPDLDWNSVKIHVAQKSGDTRPIDVFTRSFNEWQNVWNGQYHSNRCWSRDFIFSIIELPGEPNRWLFGGIFKVLSCRPAKKYGGNWVNYKVAKESAGEELIGRLIIWWVKDGRAKGRKPETMLQNMTIAEILPELYLGEDFPGYYNINHSYASLEQIWKDVKPDWYAALKHTQGIYLITDIRTGLRYVGSAYGEDGIWSRWNTYFQSGGHGNNKLLKKHLENKKDSLKYARNYFLFALLEQISTRDSEQFIFLRESYWKDLLLTRCKFGLNDN